MSLYWENQFADFNEFLRATPGARYQDWQPTKWASLSRFSDELSEVCELGGRKSTVFELGCGSATMLNQLAAGGMTCVGVDSDKAALKMAALCRLNTGLQCDKLDFVERDLFDTEYILATRGQADLVFSIGLIEHFDDIGQCRVWEAHRRLSKRWVLIGIPNYQSPLFLSFVEWARKNGRLYEEAHKECSIDALKRIAPRSVRLVDGAHLFFGRSMYYQRKSLALDSLYARLKPTAIRLSGGEWREFPSMDFAAKDVEGLKNLERIAEAAERIALGFISFVLYEV
jgi:SAM-dependent methyltransferase